MRQNIKYKDSIKMQLKYNIIDLRRETIIKLIDRKKENCYEKGRRTDGGAEKE